MCGGECVGMFVGGGGVRHYSNDLNLLPFPPPSSLPSSPQSTKDRSALRISREVEQVGGTLSATTTREHQVYGTTVMRDDL